MYKLFSFQTSLFLLYLQLWECRLFPDFFIDFFISYEICPHFFQLYIIIKGESYYVKVTKEALTTADYALLLWGRIPQKKWWKIYINRICFDIRLQNFKEFSPVPTHHGLGIVNWLVLRRKARAGLKNSYNFALILQKESMITWDLDCFGAQAFKAILYQIGFRMTILNRIFLSILWWALWTAALKIWLLRLPLS